MAIEKGDFIKINFTGKIKSTGDVYNTTIEEIAQEAGILDENSAYKPFTIIVGKTQLFSEIEDSLIGAEVGDKRTVEVPCENAFGQRDPKLIQIMHAREFKKQGINPTPGLPVQSNGTTGKILTVNGGRVKVDFNNELAGKDLICEVEVCEVIEDDDAKIIGIIETNYPSQNINFEETKLTRDGDVLNITLDPMSRFDQNQSYFNLTLKRFEIAREIYTNFEDIAQVNFVDEFKKPEETDEESSNEEENVEKEE